MKFLHLTDLHLVPKAEKLWGLSPSDRLQKCLDDIATHHADAAFLAISGDLTERGDVASNELLAEMLRGFPLQTHLMLGNHDNRENYFKVFGGGDAYGFAQHAISARGTRFLFLDTLKGPPSSAGLYDEPRRQWLAKELASLSGSEAVIFMHHPPFPIHHPLMDRIMLDDAEAFAALIEGCPVRHIFFGHAHRTISGTWRGISYSALPSLNHQLPLVGGSVPTVYSDEPPMYAVVHLDKDQITVHSDAFLNRAPAQMKPDEERGGWDVATHIPHGRTRRCPCRARA